MRPPEFKNYKGQRILHIDISDMRIENKQEAIEGIEAARIEVAKHPKNSLLILTNVQNAQYDMEIAKHMREYVAHNAPFVKRSAVIGLKGLQIPLYNAINKITGRNVKSFSTEDQAKEWLIIES